MKVSKLSFVLLLVLSFGVLVWVGCEQQPQSITEPTSEAGGSGSLSKSAADDPAIEKVKRVQEKNTDWLMAMEGVIGTGICKNPNGEGYAMAIFTKVNGMEKNLPAALEDVPCVVSNIGEVSVQAFTGRFRPFANGVSIGPGTGQCLAGTGGCIVENSAGRRGILSNSHVIAGSGSLPIGTWIHQPSPLDHIPQCVSDPNDRVGKLGLKVTINCGGTNTIDAAVSTIRNAVGFTCAGPAGTYGAPTSTPVNAFVGQSVMKIGRTTMQSSGSVTAINATISVSGYPCGVATFVNQIVTTNISSSGDSGSLVVDNNRNPVGLLFAGSTTTTISNRIQDVLGQFGVSVCDAP